MQTTMPTAMTLSMERLSRTERMFEVVRKTLEAKDIPTKTAEHDQENHELALARQALQDIHSVHSLDLLVRQARGHVR